MRPNNIISSVEQQQSWWRDMLSKTKYLISCDCFRQLLPMQYNSKPILIPKQSTQNMGRKTLVIDLDETLVHSSFNYISDPDFILKIKVMSANYTIYVRIRPGAEEFLQKMSQFYEIFIFTASISEVFKQINQYANPVIDKIDQNGVCAVRLYRPNCSVLNGVFVKDLAKLQRSINNIIIIDNTQSSFSLQPKNAIHIKNYFDDPSDTELLDLIPFLQLISTFDDVRPVGEYWKQYIRSEKIRYSRNGDAYIYDRTKNESYDVKLNLIQEIDPINQTIDLSKESSVFLDKQQLKLQTNFVVDYDEEGIDDIEFRNEQGINSPNRGNNFEQLDESAANI